MNNEKIQLLKNLIRISESKHFGVLNETLLNNIEKNIFYKTLTEDDILDVYAKLGEMTNEEIKELNKLNEKDLTSEVDKMFKKHDDEIEDDEYERLLIDEYIEFENTFYDYLNEESREERKLHKEERAEEKRWKRMLFSLRFLKERSITDILKAYYSDSEGNETSESINIEKLSKKEKLNILRSLINTKLSPDTKAAILNNPAAKELDKASTEALGIGSLSIGSAATGAGGAGSALGLIGVASVKALIPFWGVIWGGLIGGAIAGGIKVAKGLRRMRQAAVMRRDEVLAELKDRPKNVNIKESFEQESTQLSEAVTFIDNAGKVKTTTAKDYNKWMHEYDIDDSIKKNISAHNYELLTTRLKKKDVK